MPDTGTLTDINDIGRPPRPKKAQKPSYLSHDLQDELIKAYEAQPYDCHLTSYLLSILPWDEVQRVTQAYYVTGTPKPWANSTIFWQIDHKSRIHGAKVMDYDPTTGKRIKEPYPRIQWMHKVQGMEGYNLHQCLYGLHLIPERPRATIAIVESEKTAIIMAAKVPEMVWMATGGKQNLHSGLLAPLMGRGILLFPDKGEYPLWDEKAAEMRTHGHTIGTSDMLEGTDLPKGYDLADFGRTGRTGQPYGTAARGPK